MLGYGSLKIEINKAFVLCNCAADGQRYSFTIPPPSPPYCIKLWSYWCVCYKASISRPYTHIQTLQKEQKCYSVTETSPGVRGVW